MPVALSRPARCLNGCSWPFQRLELPEGLRSSMACATLRGNVQNTTKTFAISGYSEGQPVSILNFPEETTGYVLSYNDGNLTPINYSKETGTSPVANFGSQPASAAASPLGLAFAGAAQQAGQLIFATNGTSYALNLPGVNKVVIKSRFQAWCWRWCRIRTRCIAS